MALVVVVAPPGRGYQVIGQLLLLVLYEDLGKEPQRQRPEAVHYSVLREWVSAKPDLGKARTTDALAISEAS